MTKMEKPHSNPTPVNTTVKKNSFPVNTNSAKPKKKNARGKKGKKKKKQSYKDMMAAITGSSKTIEEKIKEKKDALQTPSCEPPKLVTI